MSDYNWDKKAKSVVFFLYAPFNEDMLSIFLDKLDKLKSFDCFIIYFGPQNESMIIRKEFSVVYAHYLNQDTPIKIYSRKKSP
jgi:hypothetical protein